jgi:site-specific recombinase XerD
MPIQEEFKAYLSQIGYSESTIRSHLRILHRFLAYVRSTIPHISTVDIVHFYAHLKQLNCSKNPTEMLSESYVYAHMSALKVFFNWLEINEQISCNPISPFRYILCYVRTELFLCQSE